MNDDVDIWRSANLVIKQHGDDAWLHASVRADELLNQCDLDGASTRRRVLTAISELQRVKPTEGESSR